MAIFTDKGQSAIEYLMTYGWMLIAVAVAGGAVFSVSGDQTAESISGFTGQDVQLDDFGFNTDENLDLVLRNAASNSVEINSINITDSGEYSAWKGEQNIDVGSTQTFEVGNLTQTSGHNDLEVAINYDVGGLTDLELSGSLTGGIEILESGTITGTASYNPPAEGIKVEAYDDYGDLVSSDTTRKDGRYSLTVNEDQITNISIAETVIGENLGMEESLDFELNADVVESSTDLESASEVAMSGEGTEQEPFIVETASDLQIIESSLSSNYHISETIDAGHTSQWTEGFTSIGTEENPFTGEITAPNDVEITGVDFDGGKEHLLNYSEGSINEEITMTDTNGNPVELVREIEEFPEEGVFNHFDDGPYGSSTGASEIQIRDTEPISESPEEGEFKIETKFIEEGSYAGDESADYELGVQLLDENEEEVSSLSTKWTFNDAKTETGEDTGTFNPEEGYSWRFYLGSNGATDTRWSPNNPDNEGEITLEKQ